MCDAQLIELWETYLLQLDSDEDGPPLMPAGIRAEGLPTSDTGPKDDAQRSRANATEQQAEDDGPPSLSGTTVIEGEESVRASEDTARTDDVEA